MENHYTAGWEFLEAAPQNKTRRGSFFGFDKIDSKEEKSHIRDYQIYVNKLSDEYRHWPKEYLLNKKEFLSYWKEEVDLEKDKGNLTMEQQQFLREAININGIKENHSKFCSSLLRYGLKKQYMKEKYKFCLELITEAVIDKVLKLKIEAECSFEDEIYF